MAQVYIDSDAMNTWKAEMQKINKLCIEDIQNLQINIESLSNSFQGSYEEAYSESFNKFCTDIKDSHEKMSDFSNFLDTIYEIINKQ